MGNIKISELESTVTLDDNANFLVENLVGGIPVTQKIKKSSFVASVTGPTGPTGAKGDTGAGVPTGGTTAQVLSKIDGTDYNTQWVTLLTKGYVTVGTGKDYTTFDDAISAGHKNLVCYGALSTTTLIPIGCKINLASGCTLTYTYAGTTYGVEFTGQGTLVTSNELFSSCGLFGIVRTINASGQLNMIGSKLSVISCTVNISGTTSIQIAGNGFTNTITGNKFTLTPTSGTILLQDMNENYFTIAATTSNLTLCNISSSRIFINGTSTSSLITLQQRNCLNHIEWGTLSALTINVSDGDTTTTGNRFVSGGSTSTTTFSILGGGAYDRFVFCDNIVPGTVTLNTLDRGVYCNNLIYAQAADSSVTSVTKANNQTGY